jgi:hypothetical protein
MITLNQSLKALAKSTIVLPCLVSNIPQYKLYFCKKEGREDNKGDFEAE